MDDGIDAGRRGRLRREGHPDLGGRSATTSAASPVEMDVVWFSNYEAQVEALLEGWIDVAWNTNLAYVRVAPRDRRAACRVLAMRDTDVGFRTLLVGRAGELTDANDLQGTDRSRSAAPTPRRRRSCPCTTSRREGLPPGEDVGLLRFDSDVGKHGDTGRSEREALDSGPRRQGRRGGGRGGVVGRLRPSRRGSSRPARAVLDLAPVQPLQFHGRSRRSTRERADAWTPHLLAMDWANPEHRRILELEGLREWVPPELDGYRDVFDAVEEQGIVGEMVTREPDESRPRTFDGEDLDLASGLIFALDVCLSDVEVGQVLELTSTNPALAHELPAWCRGTGHELVGAEPDGDRTRYRIRRGARGSLMFKDRPDWGVAPEFRHDGFDTRDWLVGKVAEIPAHSRPHHRVLATRRRGRGRRAGVPVHGDRT